jgi:anti-sigma factor RsiW
VTCDDIPGLLGPYGDGELELTSSLAVERHLEDCPACARAWQAQQALRARLADGSLYRRAPAGLQARIRSALPRPARARARLPALPRYWLAAAAALAGVALLGWGALRVLSVPSAEDRLAQEVVEAHVRARLLPGRLPDVPSSNQHKVKPWFSDKVGFSPPVKDLTDHDFALVGGRLDYFNGQKVAALVYRRRGHVIDLFVWPAAAEDARSPRHLTRQGFHLIHWAGGGLTCWAVSDLNEAELQEFVQAIRK